MGAIISTLAGWAVPWAGPRFTLGLVAAILAAAVCSLLFLSGALYGAGGKREALEALNLKWELKLAEAERDATLEISQQLQAATDAAALIRPATGAELDRLCAVDRRCAEYAAGDQGVSRK